MALDQRQGKMDAEERADRRALEAQARRKRFDAARERVRPFAGEHVDVCAAALIMLEWMRDGRAVTPAMVKARVRSQYPWTFGGGDD